MIKRLFMACLFAGMVFPGFAGTDDSQKNNADAVVQASTGRAEYNNLQMCLDYVADTMTDPVKYNNFEFTDDNDRAGIRVAI
jgi:hypothetical protein